jgi:hypothetical protein
MACFVPYFLAGTKRNRKTNDGFRGEWEDENTSHLVSLYGVFLSVLLGLVQQKSLGPYSMLARED